MRTIDAVMREQKGFGPGFDFLRLALALGVVAWHAHYVVAGDTGFNPDRARFTWFPDYGILVMFFALSGFLTAPSALRLGMKNFLINRGARILPALSMVVVLSAFVLGPLFTSLPLANYFTDRRTYLYLTNIIGYIDYFLPGVFTGNPTPEVNNSLWTIPFEVLCYLILAILAVLGLLRRPALIVAAAVLFVAASFVLQLIGHAAPTQHIPSAGEQQLVLQKIFGTTLFLGRGSRLIVASLLGIAAFLYRDKLPYDWRVFAACVGVCFFAAMLGPAPWMTQPILNAVVCPALVYITIFLGLARLPRLPFFSSGDYSYGIYLYGFPIQQAARTLFPNVGGFALLGIALFGILSCAVLSWHLIERPVVRLRARYSFVAKERLAPNSSAEVSNGSLPAAS